MKLSKVPYSVPRKPEPNLVLAPAYCGGLKRGDILAVVYRFALGLDRNDGDLRR